MAHDKLTSPASAASTVAQPAGQRPPFEQVGDVNPGVWEIRTLQTVPNRYPGGTNEIIAELFCEVVYENNVDTGKRVEHWLYWPGSTDRFTGYKCTFHFIESDTGQVDDWLDDRKGNGYNYVRAECAAPVAHS
jgi:hypothetical protein